MGYCVLSVGLKTLESNKGKPRWTFITQHGILQSQVSPHKDVGMRCRACDVELTDFESTRKSILSGEYIDLCNACYKYIKDDVQAIENTDNINIQDVIDLEEKL